MAKLAKLNDIVLTAFPGDPDSTPTTLSIPTPDVHDDVGLIAVRNAEWESNAEPIEVPGAPKMKDLDSFTEGTGNGSFDSIPAASTDEFGQRICRPNALTLESLPVADPNLSVELWRKEVVNVMDINDIDWLSEMTLMSPIQERYVKRPRIAFSIASDMAMNPVHSHVKRARSASPDFARRTRPRSQSLISERSASVFHATVDLVCPPLLLNMPRFLPHATAEPPD